MALLVITREFTCADKQINLWFIRKMKEEQEKYGSWGKQWNPTINGDKVIISLLTAIGRSRWIVVIENGITVHISNGKLLTHEKSDTHPARTLPSVLLIPITCKWLLRKNVCQIFCCSCYCNYLPQKKRLVAKSFPRLPRQERMRLERRLRWRWPCWASRRRGCRSRSSRRRSRSRSGRRGGPPAAWSSSSPSERPAFRHLGKVGKMNGFKLEVPHTAHW